MYELLQNKSAKGVPKSKRLAKSKALNSKEKILWEKLHQNILKEIIEDLKSPTCISYPEFDKPFIIHTDASEKGLGAVLYQIQMGEVKVISFASRTLSPAEQNYHLHSGKLEFLALKWAITEKFNDYVINGYPFEVYTDNNPPTYILTSAKLNACGLRWVAELANYNFTIKYRSGKKNIDADFLSRIPAEDLKKQ